MRNSAWLRPEAVMPEQGLCRRGRSGLQSACVAGKRSYPFGFRQKQSSPRCLRAPVSITPLPRRISWTLSCCWEGAGLSGHPSSLGSPSKLPSFRPRHSMVIPSRLDAVQGPKTLSRCLCHSLPSRDWSRKDRLSLRGLLPFEDHFLADFAPYVSSTPKGRQGSLEMARGLPLLPSQPGQGKPKPPEASRCN